MQYGYSVYLEQYLPFVGASAIEVLSTFVFGIRAITTEHPLFSVKSTTIKLHRVECGCILTKSDKSLV